MGGVRYQLWDRIIYIYMCIILSYIYNYIISTALLSYTYIYISLLQSVSIVYGMYFPTCLVVTRPSCVHSPVCVVDVLHVTALPTPRTTTCYAHTLHVLLLRRLVLPLHHTERSCRCDLSLDTVGQHLIARPTSGILGTRGIVIESTAARSCREAGGHISTNIRV